MTIEHLHFGPKTITVGRNHGSKALMDDEEAEESGNPADFFRRQVALLEDGGHKRVIDLKLIKDGT